MIYKISVLVLVSYVGCLYQVSGASFSKVYVQSGQEVIPVKYVQYGAPVLSISGSQLAQISAAPVETVVPAVSSPNLITPCNTPCLYSGPAISSVAQVPSATPNLVTYKSNVPVVEEPTGYEYSYVVYDSDTGDHKAQHESSDGTVVRGQYSLIQPDGFVREVHYTADDLNGFNAIVKKFLPVNVEAKHESTKKDDPAPPTQEANQEALKTAEIHEEHVDTPHIEAQPEVHEAESHEESHEDKHNDYHDHTSDNEHNLVEAFLHEPPFGRPCEALTEASESSEEKGSSEKKVEEHEHPEHQSELDNEHQPESHTDHDIMQETTTTIDHEQIDDLSYSDIIKCIQKAINAKDKISGPLTYIIVNSAC